MGPTQPPLSLEQARQQAGRRVERRRGHMPSACARLRAALRAAAAACMWSRGAAGTGRQDQSAVQAHAESCGGLSSNTSDAISSEAKRQASPANFKIPSPQRDAYDSSARLRQGTHKERQGLTAAPAPLLGLGSSTSGSDCERDAHAVIGKCSAWECTMFKELHVQPLQPPAATLPLPMKCGTLGRTVWSRSLSSSSSES